MTRIGFFLTPTQGWMGGINYFNNLFLAIAAAKDATVKVYVLVPPDVEPDVLDMMVPSSSNVTVVRTKLLLRRHPLWLAWRICRKLFGSELVARGLIRRYRLDAVSHSDFIRGAGVAVINWLPDFQHIHLPHMFDGQELKSRTSRYSELAARADRIVVSSEDARKDLCATQPGVAQKISVLRFVSSAPANYWTLNADDRARLLEKYQLDQDFFYVPNQFWQHKNHTILLRAIKVARELGLRVQIVCSGSTRDPRRPEYFDEFMKMAAELDCGDSLRILGIVPYKDVFSLIRFSAAVVNPSKFEGWSSTVEECKSVGKRMLLSNLSVHREQMPQAGFFDPDSAEELANLLQATLANQQASHGGLQADVQASNERRQIEYGAQYLKTVGEAIASRPASRVSNGSRA